MLSASNSIIKTKKKQAFLLVDKTPKFLSQLTFSEKNLLNILIGYNDRFSLVYPSRETLAEEVGCSVKTVQRSLNKFRDLEIMSSTYRHCDSLIIQLSGMFKDKEVRSSLSNYFPSLRFLSVLLLLVPSIVATDFTDLMGPLENVPQYTYKRINKNIYINSRLYRGGKLPSGEIDIMYQDALGPKRGSMYENLLRYDIKNRSQRLAILNKTGTINPIALAIRNVTPKLNLTRWGQIELSCYPDEAIYHAYDKLVVALESKREIKDLFSWFSTVARNYCEENNLPIDEVYRAQLKQTYNFKQHARMTLKNSTENILNSGNVCNEQHNSELSPNSNTLTGGSRDISKNTPNVCNAYIITNRNEKNKLQTYKFHTETKDPIPMRAEYNPGEYEPDYISKDSARAILKSLGLSKPIVPDIKKLTPEAQHEEDCKQLDSYVLITGESVLEAYFKYNSQQFRSLLGQNMYEVFERARRRLCI